MFVIPLSNNYCALFPGMISKIVKQMKINGIEVLRCSAVAKYPEMFPTLEDKISANIRVYLHSQIDIHKKYWLFNAQPAQSKKRATLVRVNFHYVVHIYNQLLLIS